MTLENGETSVIRLRVCFVMPHYAQDVEPADLPGYLARTPIHLALPRELAARGHEVNLIHSWPTDATFTEAGVHFHFVSEPGSSQAAAKLLGRLRHRDPLGYLPARQAIKLIRSLQPDVIHFHGSTLNLNLFLLLRALRALKPVVTVHYHGGYPARHPIARRLQRSNFDRVDRLCFTTSDQANPFIESGVLRRPERIVELIETSSTFQPGDRDAARRSTGMTGEPVFLSVGRLHPIKDPLTILRGFAQVLERRPRAQLYLYYTSEELLPDVRAYLYQHPALSDQVHLRGRAAYEQMETIYNSADFLLQASLREFSGCAVLEAMACGVIPLVSDIPSFRAMTAAGRYGKLFPIGHPEELARQALAIDSQSLPKLRGEVREHFERSLGFAQMAEMLEGTFLNLLSERRSLPQAELKAT